MKKIISGLALPMAISFNIKAQSIPVSGNQYHLYGPNSYNVYFQVGGHNRITSDGSIYASNGNVHIDSKSNSAIYLNHYSFGNTYINAQGGFVGIGTENPQEKLSVNGDIGIRNSLIPMGLTTEVTGTSNPLLNLDVNFRGVNKNIAYRGGVMRIDTRDNINLFQWISRPAGSTVEQVIMNFSENGNLGIGTFTPKEKLSVNGKIRAHEIKVETANWPDYVFEDDYRVGTLEALESYIKAHKHLPEMPSAKEVEGNGVALGEMNKLLLKKIEELTLHLIEKDKEVKTLKSDMETVKGLLNQLVHQKK